MARPCKAETPEESDYTSVQDRIVSAKAFIVHDGNASSPSFGAANFTVTSTPEPTSAMLLAGGMFGLIVRRRRR